VFDIAQSAQNGNHARPIPPKICGVPTAEHTKQPHQHQGRHSQ
jgi:hypothetical protein